MALKKLSNVVETAKPTKESVPVITVENSAVTRFNQAKSQLKEAEAIVEELEPVIKQLGLKHIFKHNVEQPTAPWTSVKLEDKNTGEKCRVSATSAYVIANPDNVEQAFTALGKDSGDYAQFVTKSAFNDKVFIVGNEFNQDVYAAYKSAIDAVTATLKAQGVLPSSAESPLSSKQVVMPKPDFHDKRWAAFPSVDDQMAIQKVLPMKVAAVADVK